ATAAVGYECEVRVHDSQRQRPLVAAVELVSPANKDRPENRRAFVARCAALLQQHVSVGIVDLVTTRHFNRYGDFPRALTAQTGGRDEEPTARLAGRTEHFDLPRQGWIGPQPVGQDPGATTDTNIPRPGSDPR